jgi:hypothetical protein
MHSHLHQIQIRGEHFNGQQGTTFLSNVLLKDYAVEAAANFAIQLLLSKIWYFVIL